MYMDLDKPEGFTNDEMEAEIRAMIRAAMQAEAKAYGLWEGAEQLQNAFINEFIRDRKIKKGDKVRVDFSDGAEVLIFDEVRNGRIYAFYLTKKGKPRRYATGFDYGYAELFHHPEDKAEGDE